MGFHKPKIPCVRTPILTEWRPKSQKLKQHAADSNRCIYFAMWTLAQSNKTQGLVIMRPGAMTCDPKSHKYPRSLPNCAPFRCWGSRESWLYIFFELLVDDGFAISFVCVVFSPLKRDIIVVICRISRTLPVST